MFKLQIKIYLIIFFNIFLSSLQAIIVKISLILIFKTNIIARVKRLALKFIIDCAILLNYWQIIKLLSKDLRSKLYILNRQILIVLIFFFAIKKNYIINLTQLI